MHHSNLSERIALLPPEKRALLEQRLLEQARGAAATGIPRRAGAGPCPLSLAQERLWFLEQLQPNTATYNIPSALELRGPLDVGALEQSLAEIIRRHEALRTTFEAVEGEPRQVVTPPAAVPLPTTDLRELPEAQREAEACRLADEEASRPFDLARGPLFRARLLRLAEDEHVLVLTMHHIVSDGWSMGVLVRELGALYAAFSRGQPSPLPALPIQYADYAVWQREWLQGEVLEAQLGYWKQQLAGAPPVLELPTDYPRPPFQSYHGARQAFTLHPDLAEALRVVGRREGATLYMTLLAALQALLGRYTAREDVLVGSPIAGRTRAELEGLIGFFVNTLVLRADISGEPSFRELLARVREVCLEAYARQDLPFDKLVEELQPERDLSRSPLVQVLFVLQNAPRQALELAGLSVRPLAVETGTAKFELSLSLSERADGLHGFWEYNTDLFEAGTIERLAGHFRTLLEGIVADPEQRVSELPLLTAAERHQILVEWNGTEAEYPRDRCFHELFEAQVERTPDAVAMSFEGQELTYRELNRQANQLAHHLQRVGVGPEVPVGICVERSPELVIGLLGIFKAGGAFVPLDPTYPKERLAFMLRDARTPVLLTQQRLDEQLPEYGGHVLRLDAAWEHLADQSGDNPVSRTTADNLAYVIYTSGSTGTPKGVAVEHQSLVNYLTWVNESILGPTVHVLPTVTKLTFDASLKQVLAPLLSGGEVWMLPEDVAMEPAALLRAINARTGVGLNCVPTLWEAVLDAIRSGRGPTPVSLDCLLLGGERFGQELVERSLAILPNLQIWNCYGPTETTANSVVGRIMPGAEVTIGRPIANTRIYLLDRHLNPVPVGIPGELHIGGDGLARGYVNRPELTAERFIPDPFGEEPDARLYRTGDLARYRPDGRIEYLGRLDDQVKFRGFRIELGEIETVLSQHTAVREAVVLVREDHAGDRRLVAYVVPRDGRAPASGDLHRHLRERLPGYMVPAAFVALDALPLTSNGKVDRRALPAPERTRDHLGSTFVAPRTLTERTLARIWADLLGLERVGTHDDFFDLGGHSLLAVRLLAKVEAAFGARLPLTTLFQGGTIEHLAEAMQQQPTAWPSLIPVQTGGSRPPFFYVHALTCNAPGYALARALGPDQPVYGIQARGLDGVQEPLETIEAMAAHYLEEVRAVQSNGPYYLGGFSAGGKVAFEMARQLVAAGQEVAVLAIIDTGAKAGGRKSPSLASRLKSRLREFIFVHWLDQVVALRRRFRKGKRRASRSFIDHFAKMDSRRRRELKHSFRELRKLSVPGASPDIDKIVDAMAWLLLRDRAELPEHHRRVIGAFCRALVAYTPGPYSGRVELFRSSGSHRSREADLGWGKLAAGGVSVCEVSGRHLTMMRERHVHHLARELRQCLDEAQARSGGP